MIMIDKVVAPQPVGPMTIYKHDIPDADLRQAKASSADFFNGRLHEAHVIRLHGSYVAFSKNEPLPTGGFSDNYVGVHSSYGYVAVKRLRVVGSCKGGSKERCAVTPQIDIEKEFELATKLGRKAAPHFAVQTYTKAYIISPLFECDSMYVAALGEARFPRSVLVYRFLRDVATHLKHVHGKGFIHNDVKPNNVLVLRKADDLEFVLCDYGLSCSFNPYDYPGGNAWYGAPEETLDYLPEARSDVYSLGLSCMTLINNVNPFDSIFTRAEEVSSQVREDAYEAFETVRLGKKGLHPRYEAIFRGCWQTIEKQVSFTLVRLIKAMVARPVKGSVEERRIDVDELLARLEAARPTDEAMRGWRAGVRGFKPNNIAVAKRQARIIEDALISRNRLPVPPRQREAIDSPGRGLP